jgi:MYXO-CTERM domain-containing protein
MLWVDSDDTATTIPEPGGLALGLAGLSVLLVAQRRRGIRSVAGGRTAG